MKCILVLASLFIAMAVATAPMFNMESKTRIPDQYIVVLHETISVEQRDSHVEDLTLRLTGKEYIMHKYAIGDLIGYSAVLSKEHLVEQLEHPNVKYIEADQTCSIVADTPARQTNATWGLNRISQVNRNADGIYNYWTSSGRGVVAYIIDTGIRTTHVDFGGRAIIGTNTVGDGNNNDGNGHGTHVASTTGGTTWGVAKHATLVAVKVLNSGGSGSWAGVIAGVDWVTGNHTARKAANKHAWSTANMSLGGGATPTLDTAVNNSIKSGVVYAVAGGNDNGNACNSSPARLTAALTVGASTNTDARASFSNYGNCLDIFAPGQSITAAWSTSDVATNTISGTSMASPHVCGAVAVHLGHLLDNDNDAVPPDPYVVDKFLVGAGSRDKITGAGTGSPNILLFSPFSDSK